MALVIKARVFQSSGVFCIHHDLIGAPEMCALHVIIDCDVYMYIIIVQTKL